MLEVALVLPVLMITLVAISDLGRYVYATNLMPYLAREGVRWASLSGREKGDVAKYVRSLAAGLPEDSVQVETTLGSRSVAVHVTWTFTPVLNVFGGPLTVKGRAALSRRGGERP
jgi:Flp pilus assembly protein TadG